MWSNRDPETREHAQVGHDPSVGSSAKGFATSTLTGSHEDEDISRG